MDASLLILVGYIVFGIFYSLLLIPLIYRALSDDPSTFEVTLYSIWIFGFFAIGAYGLPYSSSACEIPAGEYEIAQDNRDIAILWNGMTGSTNDSYVWRNFGFGGNDLSIHPAVETTENVYGMKIDRKIVFKTSDDLILDTCDGDIKKLDIINNL